MDQGESPGENFQGPERGMAELPKVTSGADGGGGRGFFGAAKPGPGEKMRSAAARRQGIFSRIAERVAPKKADREGKKREGRLKVTNGKAMKLKNCKPRGHD
jgi:hypothetical protein